MIWLWSFKKLIFLFCSMAGVFGLSIYRPNYGYLFLTSVVFLRPQDDRPVFATLHVPMILIIFITIGLIYHVNKGNIRLDQAIRLSTFKLFSLFVLFMVISACFSHFPETAWLATMDFQFISAFFVFTIFLLNKETEFRNLIYVILVCGLYFAYLLQFKGSAMIETISANEFSRGNFMKLNMNFGNPNYLAITMVIMFSFAFSQFLYYRKFLPKLLFLSLGLVYIYTLINTMSRGGTLSFVVAIALFFFHLKRKSLGLVVLAAASITAFVVVSAYYPAYLERLETIKTYKEDASATKRLEYWQKGLALIAENPALGVGPDSFKNLVENTPHNSYVQVASEIGLPAFFIWLALLVKGWTFSRKAMRFFQKDMARYRRMYYISLAIEISLVSCMVQSLFTGMGHREILFFLIAMGSAAYLMTKEKPDVKQVTFAPQPSEFIKPYMGDG